LVIGKILARKKDERKEKEPSRGMKLPESRTPQTIVEYLTDITNNTNTVVKALSVFFKSKTKVVLS